MMPSKSKEAQMRAHRRHDISDTVWPLLKPHLPGREGSWGGQAKDNRQFINAVFWIMRTGGAPWRDLPPDYGCRSKRGQSRYESHKRGLNTKLQLAVDSNGMPVKAIITKSTTADCTQAFPLIQGIIAEHLLADRGYDTNVLWSMVLTLSYLQRKIEKNRANMMNTFIK